MNGSEGQIQVRHQTVMDDEARQVAARFMALRPGFSLDAYRRTRLPFFDSALRAAFAANLREAGLPD